MTAPNPMTLSYLGAIEGSWVGSMSEGSNQLTLTTSNHPIRVGHDIIVQIGGEAGGGARGTVGVGGTWPPLANALADEAAILASAPPDIPSNHGQPARWALDTGEVYFHQSSAWSQPHAAQYEQLVVLPLSLLATVVAVNGATLTLNRTASVETSGATVYIDAFRALSLALTSPHGEVRLDGTYAVGSQFSGGSNPHVTLFGDSPDASELFSPLGCASLRLQIISSHDITLASFTARRVWTESAIWHGREGYFQAGAHTVAVQTSERPALQGLRIIDGGFGSAALSFCSDGEIRGVEAIHSAGFYTRHYASWAVQLADCERCRIIDGSFDSDYVHEAFEIFKGEDCAVEGFVTRNGVGAINTSMRPAMSGLDVTLSAQLGAERDALDPFRPNAVLNLNRAFAPSPAEAYDISDSTFSIEAAPGGLITGVVAFHDAMAADGAASSLTNVTIETNGHVHALGAISLGPPVQDLDIDGLTTDGRVDLHYGSVANSTIPDLRYCGDSVTFGSGNNITSQTDVCA